MDKPWCYKDIPGYQWGSNPTIDRELAKAAHYRLAARIMFSLAGVFSIMDAIFIMVLFYG